MTKERSRRGRQWLVWFLVALMLILPTACRRQNIQEVTGPEIIEGSQTTASPSTGSAETAKASKTEPESTETVTKAPETTKAAETTPLETNEEEKIARDGIYTTKEDVALYLHTYGELPSNFITKKEAQKLGWSGGSLEPYMKNGCIGGDYFGNYEGVLPKGNGLSYHECDIDTLGQKKRGTKRLVFSNKGDIYYTEDHYETFTQLY